MKILLIYPGGKSFEITPDVRFSTGGAFLPPLGLLYLGKILELQGHSIKVIDCNTGNFKYNSLYKEIKSSDIIGMTIYSGENKFGKSIQIAKKIRELTPDIPFIIGGPHCTIVPEQALNHYTADIAVCGEAEYIINPIIEAIQGKRELSSIPGIVYQRNGKIKKTKENQQIQDLDDIPYPSRNLVKENTYGYLLGEKIIKGKVTSLIGSRGCPNKCKFCQVSSFLPKYRSRSAQNIIGEIDEIVSDGYNSIAFVDDNFLAQKKKVETIMEHIIRQHYDLNLWIIDTRVDSADRHLYEKMRDAGVTNIFFGIESGNQEVLNYYNKNFTLDQVRYAVNLSKEMGFLVVGNFIIGAPIETKKHIQDTIKFAKSLPLDTAIFNHFSYIWGAEFWKEAVKQGKIDPNEFWVLSDAKRGLAQFDSKKIDDYCLKASRNFFFNPLYWFREIGYALSHRNFSILSFGLRMFHLK